MLEGNTWLVKERVAWLKLTDQYEILEPETGQTLGTAKEEPPGWAKMLRLAVNKHILPTTVNIYEDGVAEPLFFIKRAGVFIRAKVVVHQQDGTPIGYFKAKLLTLGGGFHVFNMQDQPVAEIKGDWKGWNFKLLGPGGNELGTVTKKWAGIGKELFTSADNYIIALSENATQDEIVKKLLLAAGLSIDLVYGERR